MDGINQAELSRCLFEESNDAFFIFDSDDNRILDANPTAERLTGMRRKQLLGTQLQDILRADDAHTIEELIRAYQTTGVFHSKEGYWLRSESNGLLAVNVSVSRIHTKPEPLGLVTVRDISERVRANKILWSLVRGTSTAVGADFFASLVQHLASSFDARYAIVAEHLDSPVTRVRTLAFWMGDKLGNNVEYDVAGTPCEKTVAGEFTYYPKNTQQLFPGDEDLVNLGVESYCGVPLKDVAGKIIGHLAVLDSEAMEENLCETPAFQIFVARAAAELERREVEDRAQQIQSQLEHVCRVSSMGEMASTLAHEINQPLGAMANNAQAAVRGIEHGRLDSSEVLNALKDITADAFRASEIIRRLREFVSRRVPRKSTVLINDLVQEVVRLIDFDARNHKVKLQLDLEERLPHIQLDRIQIQQVLINLLRNAFEAMNEIPETERRVTLGTSENSDEITIRVTDTGKGIPEAEIKRAFEPYVTTKPEGLGMGLCISRSIVEWHGGRIFGIPNSESGMTFGFTLPLHGGFGS